MPVVRSSKKVVRVSNAGSKNINMNKNPRLPGPMFPVHEAKVDLAKCDSVKYPLNSEERASFRTKAGKRVTPHQWAVYDFVRTIPLGKVTTYKDIANALGEGSPRSVGGALRNNPFAPFVPCHRIVASNMFVGGFYGEWGMGDRSDSQGKKKMEMLAQEGVGFSKEGYILDANVVWKGQTFH